MKPNPADAALIIGFDAEWVTEPTDLPMMMTAMAGSMTSTIPAQIPHNLILSCKYGCRYKGREWSGIVYTRAAPASGTRRKV